MKKIVQILWRHVMIRKELEKYKCINITLLSNIVTITYLKQEYFKTKMVSICKFSFNFVSLCVYRYIVESRTFLVEGDLWFLILLFLYKLEHLPALLLLNLFNVFTHKVSFSWRILGVHLQTPVEEGWVRKGGAKNNINKGTLHMYTISQSIIL